VGTDIKIFAMRPFVRGFAKRRGRSVVSLSGEKARFTGSAEQEEFVPKSRVQLFRVVPQTCRACHDKRIDEG
jgi:hypothetical protein